jgi:hypothetical protein
VRTQNREKPKKKPKYVGYKGSGGCKIGLSAVFHPYGLSDGLEPRHLKLCMSSGQKDPTIIEWI